MTPARTVLAVDDDPHVRLLVQRLLVGAGYAVLSAASGAEALATLSERGAQIDLLLTDVMLGDLHGGELVRRAREVRPELRVVYTSGHARTSAALEGLPPADGFLLKPYRAEDLAQAVGAALNARDAGP